MTRTRLVLLALAALAGTGLVACGGDKGENIAGLSANEILDRAQQAIADARSVHVSGSTVDNDGTKLKLDFHISEGGSTGTMTAKNFRFDILVADKNFFLKGDKAAWTTLSGEASAGELLGGRYVKVPTSGNQDFKDIETLADWDSFIKDAFEPDGKVTKGQTKTLDGVAVIGLVDHGKDGGTLWIPVEGPPLPVQGIDSDGSRIDFADWGEPVTIETPSADEVIDLSALTS